MRILLINPPHPSIGSRIPREQLPPLGLRQILSQEPQIDFIVRGEREETTPRLIRALEAGGKLPAFRGIAFGENGVVIGTQRAPAITDLDARRIGWELIDHRRYSYCKRAVVVQFSRGCPRLCNYCGQRGFWTRFRHRDPKKFAAEVARLHREHGVEVINFADEDPSASPKAWRAFLEALIAENVNLTLVGSTRADDIVEETDEATLRLIRKDGGTAKDREAIRLLRQHDILSTATWVVGFEEKTERDLLRGLRQLLSYDPDQILVLYVTPHRWTLYFRIARDRRVVQIDQRRWDYKHQVPATRYMAPWRLIFWVKFIELVVQSRPRALWRLVAHPDPKIRHAVCWYYRMGRRVWFYEIWNFLFRDRREKDGPTLAQFWGAPQDAEEESMIANTKEGLADGRVIARTSARDRALRLVASERVEEVS